MTDKKSSAQSTAEHRNRLGNRVILGSFLLLFAVVIFLVIVPLFVTIKGDNFKESKDLFMAILPIVSGWVGGVLGFYFSEQAAESRGEQVLQAQGGAAFAARLREVPVTEVMVDKERIKKVILKLGSAGDTRLGAGNSFEELTNVVSRPGFTRAPMFRQNGDDIIYHAMAHESLIFRYEAKIRSEGTDPTATTIADFLESDLYTERAEGATEFVSRSATLEDAKAKMQRNKRGAQDVFITVSGAPDSPVIGWITNVDILRRSVARAED